MPDDDDDDMEDARERALERGRVWWTTFNAQPIDERFEFLATSLYIDTLVDYQGYPNGMPTWDELVELDHNQPHLSKSNFRHAVWACLKYSGAFTDEELRGWPRRDWIESRNVASYQEPGEQLHETYKRLTLERWEIIGPGLRRRMEPTP